LKSKKNIIHEVELIGHYSASISIIEIGLGSLLHAASIPLSGHILSINQSAIMARASFISKSQSISLKISLISSILKSLSPAGKKLTPMLAILVQGCLFSIGLTFLGVNFLGLFLAVALSSLWAFIQPVILIYFLFGKTIIDVLNYFKKDFTFLTNIAPEVIIKLLLLSYILKLFIGYIYSLYVIKMSETKFASLQSKMKIKESQRKRKNFKNQMLNAFFDLLQPIFIICFLLTALFLFHSEGSFVKVIWMLLRPIALGLILFYIIRIYPMDKLIIFLEKRKMVNISKSLKVALEIINKDKN
jgi:hypothetical protein